MRKVNKRVEKRGEKRLNSPSSEDLKREIDENCNGHIFLQ